MDLTAQLEQLQRLVGRPVDENQYPPVAQEVHEYEEAGHTDAVHVIGNLAFEPSDPLLDPHWRGAADGGGAAHFGAEADEFVPAKFFGDGDPASMNPDAASFYPPHEADERYSGWDGKGGFVGWGGEDDGYGSWSRGWPPGEHPPKHGPWMPKQPSAGPHSKIFPSGKGGKPPYHTQVYSGTGAAPPAGYQPPYGWDAFSDPHAKSSSHANLSEFGMQPGGLPPAPVTPPPTGPLRAADDLARDAKLAAALWYILDPKKKTTSGPFSTLEMKIKNDEGELRKMRVRAEPDQSWRSVGELFPQSSTAFAVFPKKTIWLEQSQAQAPAKAAGSTELDRWSSVHGAGIRPEGERSSGGLAAIGSAQHRRSELDSVVREMASGQAAFSFESWIKQLDRDPWSSDQSIQAKAVGLGKQFAESIVLNQEQQEQPRWEYKDPKGNRQGPFSRAQMRMWHSKGHLPSYLLCRMSSTSDYRPLSELLAQNPDLFGENGPPTTGFDPVPNAEQPGTSKLSDDAVCVRKIVSGSVITHFVISLENSAV